VDETNATAETAVFIGSDAAGTANTTLAAVVTPAAPNHVNVTPSSPSGPDDFFDIHVQHAFAADPLAFHPTQPPALALQPSTSTTHELACASASLSRWQNVRRWLGLGPRQQTLVLPGPGAFGITDALEDFSVTVLRRPRSQARQVSQRRYFPGGVSPRSSASLSEVMLAMPTLQAAIMESAQAERS